MVDFGKVVHYHFDKLTHSVPPTCGSGQDFRLMRENSKNYEVDTDDFPYLRARPVWVTPDESPESIQNEINLFADGKKECFTIGRSSKREILLKMKSISGEHCAISYSPEKGWFVTERAKNKLSSNGTYLFLKTHEQ